MLLCFVVLLVFCECSVALTCSSMGFSAVVIMGVPSHTH